jgi:hypothetical protein
MRLLQLKQPRRLHQVLYRSWLPLKAIMELVLRQSLSAVLLRMLSMLEEKDQLYSLDLKC